MTKIKELWALYVLWEKENSALAKVCSDVITILFIFTAIVAASY